ncbi:MAG: hypothetical protein KGP01_00120 [Actinomycetales bacterium]|nr:hypothetical protein [Actinomycetales bacterium]
MMVLVRLRAVMGLCVLVLRGRGGLRMSVPGRRMARVRGGLVTTVLVSLVRVLVRLRAAAVPVMVLVRLRAAVPAMVFVRLRAVMGLCVLVLHGRGGLRMSGPVRRAAGVRGCLVTRALVSRVMVIVRLRAAAVRATLTGRLRAAIRRRVSPPNRVGPRMRLCVLSVRTAHDPHVRHSGAVSATNGRAARATPSALALGRLQVAATPSVPYARRSSPEASPPRCPMT